MLEKEATLKNEVSRPCSIFRDLYIGLSSTGSVGRVKFLKIFKNFENSFCKFFIVNIPGSQ